MIYCYKRELSLNFLAQATQEAQQFSLCVDGVEVIADDDDIRLFEIRLAGPKDTYYEGGTFVIEMYVPENFPQAAPKLLSKTPIYHVNFDDLGKCFEARLILLLFHSLLLSKSA